MVLILALVGPALLWAISNLIDKVLTPTPCTSRALSLVFVSSGIGLLTTPALILFGATPWNLPTQDLIRTICSGSIYIFACYPYFRAMQRSNPATVAVLMQTIPVFNYLLAYLLLGEQLSLLQFLGILFVIAACSVMCGLHRILHEKVDFTTFFLGILCSLTFAIPAVLFRSGAPQELYLDATCATQFGTMIPLFFYFLFPHTRGVALTTLSQLRGRFFALNLTNELITQIATVWFRSAFYLIPVSIAVPVTQSLQTFFVYLLSLGVASTAPRLRNHFAGTVPPLQSLAAIVLCAVGIYLLYK